jgi:hypothetical protein
MFRDGVQLHHFEVFSFECWSSKLYYRHVFDRRCVQMADHICMGKLGSVFPGNLEKKQSPADNTRSRA